VREGKDDDEGIKHVHGSKRGRSSQDRTGSNGAAVHLSVNPVQTPENEQREQCRTGVHCDSARQVHDRQEGIRELPPVHLCAVLYPGGVGGTERNSEERGADVRHGLFELLLEEHEVCGLGAAGGCSTLCRNDVGSQRGNKGGRWGFGRRRELGLPGGGRLKRRKMKTEGSRSEGLARRRLDGRRWEGRRGWQGSKSRDLPAREIKMTEPVDEGSHSIESSCLKPDRALPTRIAGSWNKWGVCEDVRRTFRGEARSTYRKAESPRGARASRGPSRGG